MLRSFIAILTILLGLSACTSSNDLGQSPVYLGNFHFGHNVVVAPNIVRGPASRKASNNEWIKAVDKAVEARFRRFEGSKLYHLGISVEGYVLAVAGVPVVAAPKSVLILRVTAWDDAMKTKLNKKPKVITAVENLSGETLVSSGLTQTKEEQIENLSQNAAKQIENWLVEMNNENGWFQDDGRPANPKDKSADRF